MLGGVIVGILGGLFWGAVITGLYRWSTRKLLDRRAVDSRTKRVFAIAFLACAILSYMAQNRQGW